MLDGPLPASPASTDSNTSKASLNELLLEVLVGVQQNCRHAKAFQTVVTLDEVADYHLYVHPRDATACLEQIFLRVQHGAYTSVRAFRREFEQVLANALAYNTPGNGRLAYKPVIGWAQDLLETCCIQLEVHREALSAAVKRAKEPFKHAHLQQRDLSRCYTQGTGAPCATSSLDALLAVCEMFSQQEGFHGGQEQRYSNHDTAATKDDRQDGAAQAQNGDDASEITTEPQTCSQGAQDAQLLCLSPPINEGALATSALAVPAQHDSTLVPVCPGMRHCSIKSKVFIRPNKVIYLPSKFIEDHFDTACLPLNCHAIVEANGIKQAERHLVTIKAVPRQGRSTMYCMANVMPFQQQYINWQVVLWSKVDDHLITIHLQSPGDVVNGSKPSDIVLPTFAKILAVSHKRKCEEEAEGGTSLERPAPGPQSLGYTQPEASVQTMQQLYSGSHGSKGMSPSRPLRPTAALGTPGVTSGRGKQLPGSSSGISRLATPQAASSSGASGLPPGVALQPLQQQYQAPIQQPGSVFQAAAGLPPPLYHPLIFAQQAMLQPGGSTSTASPACSSGASGLTSAQQQQQQMYPHHPHPGYAHGLPPQAYPFPLPHMLRPGMPPAQFHVPFLPAAHFPVPMLPVVPGAGGAHMRPMHQFMHTSSG